jgi:hypothetical protein
MKPAIFGAAASTLPLPLWHPSNETGLNEKAKSELLAHHLESCEKRALKRFSETEVNSQYRPLCPFNFKFKYKNSPQNQAREAPLSHHHLSMLLTHHGQGVWVFALWAYQID